jgi:hypothetical protein
MGARRLASADATMTSDTSERGCMVILAIHETPSLTRERYEQVVRRLTGKERIESPSDLPFDGLLVHAADRCRTVSACSTSSNQRRRWSAFDRRSARSRRTSGSRNHPSSFQRTPRYGADGPERFEGGAHRMRCSGTGWRSRRLTARYDRAGVTERGTDIPTPSDRILDRPGVGDLGLELLKEQVPC